MNTLAISLVIMVCVTLSRGENKKRGVYGESLGFGEGVSYHQSLGSSLGYPGIVISPSGQVLSDAYGLSSSRIIYGNGGYGYGRGYGYGNGYDYGNIIGNSGVGVGSVVSKQVTVTNNVAVPVPQPYPVQVTQTVAVPVPQPVAVPVEKPYPVTIDRPYPVAVSQTYPVRAYSPVAVAVPKPVSIPVVNTVRVSQPYDTRKTIPVYENGINSASFETHGTGHGQATLTGGYSSGSGPLIAGTGLTSFASGISSGWLSDPARLGLNL